MTDFETIIKFLNKYGIAHDIEYLYNEDETIVEEKYIVIDDAIYFDNNGKISI